MVDEAEACYGLDVDFYLSDVSTCAPQPGPSLRLDEMLLSAIKSLTQHSFTNWEVRRWRQFMTKGPYCKGYYTALNFPLSQVG